MPSNHRCIVDDVLPKNLKCDARWSTPCGTVTVVMGDSLEVIPQIKRKSIGALISDPPYGNTNIEWDSMVCNLEFWTKSLPLLNSQDAAVVLFSCGLATRELMHRSPFYRYKYVWVKPGLATGHLDVARRPMRAHEDVLIFSRQQPRYFPQKTPGKLIKRRAGVQAKAKHWKTRDVVLPESQSTTRYPTDVLTFERDKNKVLGHQTMKPVALMEFLVRSYCPPADVCLDPFGGSGSTAVACMNAGIRCVTIERERQWFDCIVARLRTHKVPK